MNPDGTLTSIGPIPLTATGNSNFIGTIGVSDQEDVTAGVPISTPTGNVPGTITYAATGPVPYLKAPILGVNDSLAVPFAPAPSVSLAVEAVSTLPVTFQWTRDGVPLAGETRSTYTGIVSQASVYSVTASTTVGSVTSQANVILTVDGLAASTAPKITLSPTNRTITGGISATLTARAISTSFVSFQWLKDAMPIPGATNVSVSAQSYGRYDSTLEVTQPGIYSVRVSTAGAGGGSAESTGAEITVIDSSGHKLAPAPELFSAPQSTTFVYGRTVHLSASAGATLPITYQWQVNGVDLPGATSSSYDTNVIGAYTIVASTSAGAVKSAIATVTLSNRPANLSSRLQVGTASRIGIAGFVVASYTGAPKRLLLRAVGPSLASLGLSGGLPHPVLSLFDASGQLLASNSGWQNDATVDQAARDTGAFPLVGGSTDSALLLDLPPGTYTAQVAGANDTTGVALLEVYETSADNGHLVNLSTRGAVGTGDSILIGGLVVGGSTPSLVLVRAAGPALQGLGVSGILEKPTLSIFNAAGVIVAGNVGWSNGSSNDIVTQASIARLTGAFPFQIGSSDCAVLTALPPGNYTVQVSGVNQTTGIALVEIYQVPQ